MWEAVGEKACHSKSEGNAECAGHEDQRTDIDRETEDIMDVLRDQSAEDDHGGGDERELDGSVHHGGIGLHLPPTRGPPAALGRATDLLSFWPTDPSDGHSIHCRHQIKPGANEKKNARLMEYAQHEGR